MDLYPLILESTDLQQTSEINSTKNVKASDVNFPLRDIQSLILIRNLHSIDTTVNNDVQSILDSIHIIRLPLRWACYSRAKLRN
jgi:hypothetical protein